MSAQLAQQSYEVVDVAQLKTHPMNPRRGDVTKIASSIDVHGFYGSVVAQRSTGFVIAGNHRLLAARKLGIASLPVIWVDCDDDKARRILAVDNRSSDVASYDDDELIELLRSFDDDLTGTGFDEADLLKLLGSEDSEDGDGDSQLDEGSLSIIVECQSEQQQSELLERFEAEGLSCRPLMM